MQTAPAFHSRLNGWLALHSWFPLLVPWPLPLKTPQMFVIPWVLGPICLHAPLSLSLGVQDHTVPYPTLFLPPTPTLEIQPSDGCLQRAHQHLTLASQTLLLFHCPNLSAPPPNPVSSFLHHLLQKSEIHSSSSIHPSASSTPPEWEAAPSQSPRYHPRSNYCSCSDLGILLRICLCACPFPH